MYKFVRNSFHFEKKTRFPSIKIIVSRCYDVVTKLIKVSINAQWRSEVTKFPGFFLLVHYKELLQVVLVQLRSFSMMMSFPWEFFIDTSSYQLMKHYCRANNTFGF